MSGTGRELEEYQLQEHEHITCGSCGKEIDGGEVVWVVTRVGYPRPPIAYVCLRCMDAGEARIRG